MICALCKEEKGKLVDSHFMPAAAYSHIRGSQPSGNNSPVRISLSKSKSFRTDKQVKRPLLCSRCEDLFSKNGEKVMGDLWATKSSFPLLELLKKSALISHGEHFNIYDSKRLEGKIVDALFYFAMSIFWRAHVWDWQWEEDGYKRALGPYEKDFRDFLLKGKKLNNVFLVLDVNSDPKTAAVMGFPTCTRSGSDRLHRFILLGITFMMYLGKGISSIAREPFDLLGVQTYIVSTDLSKSPSFVRLAERVQSQTFTEKFIKDLLKN